MSDPASMPNPTDPQAPFTEGLLRLDGDPAVVAAFLRELQLDEVLRAGNGNFEAVYAAVVKLCVADERHRRYACDLALGLLQLREQPAAQALGLRLLRLLAEDGVPHARFNLAMERFAGQHLPADPAAGNRLLQQVLDAPCKDPALLGAVHCALADSHALGRGLPADPERALALYEQAAAFGSADGAYNAGLIHHGRFAPGGAERYEHLERAAGFYEVAITQGSVPALYNLAIIRLLAGFAGRDDAGGVALLQRAAAAGDARAHQALELLLAA